MTTNTALWPALEPLVTSLEEKYGPIAASDIDTLIDEHGQELLAKVAPLNVAFGTEVANALTAAIGSQSWVSKELLGAASGSLNRMQNQIVEDLGGKEAALLALVRKDLQAYVESKDPSAGEASSTIAAQQQQIGKLQAELADRPTADEATALRAQVAQLEEHVAQAQANATGEPPDGGDTQPAESGSGAPT